MIISKRSLFTTLVILCAVVSSSLQAAEQRLGVFYINPVLAHWMEYQAPNLLDDGSLWGARFGVNLCPWFGIEGFGLRGPTEISPNDAAGMTKVGASYSAWGAAARLMLPAGPVVPFLTVGLGRASMKPDNALSAINGHPVRVESSESRGLGVFGAGLEVPLHRNISLRFDAIDHYIKKDFIEGDWRGDRKTHNWELGAGVNLLFGKPGVRKLDSDRDGVTDDQDKCPGTPAGVKVYSDGCPVDTDHDGVPDYLDKCPGTPAGTKVNSDGCELKQEPAPAPAPKAEPAPPADSDHDGVTDDKDQCPDTPAGVKVDTKGCPAVNPDDYHVDVYFDFNQALVKSEYFGPLDRLAQLLGKSGETVNLIGFTDQKGSNTYNQTLSLRRAEAVRDYLISKGVAPARIQLKGSGKFPLETSESAPAAGKQRRVMIQLNDN